MRKKEPDASKEEYGRYVIHFPGVPTIDLIPGVKAHIVSAEKITLSFAIGEPNAQLPPHRHPNEQMLIILDGAMDLAIEGKRYNLEIGDVAILPSNTEHGGYISDKGCRVIDVFSPPREDFVARLEEVEKKQ
jgi:quercetin dioxygenase-like cupin family protein